jgi:hypothetical protein
MVKFQSYVFGARAELGVVVGEGNAGGVILVNCGGREGCSGGIWTGSGKFLEDAANGDEFPSGSTECDILSFGGAKCDFGLEFAAPMYRAAIV